MSTTDLTLYRNRAYLELCLELVSDAYTDLKKGDNELAQSQLQDILETFDYHTTPQEQDGEQTKAPVIDFPHPRKA